MILYLPNKVVRQLKRTDLFLSYHLGQLARALKRKVTHGPGLIDYEEVLSRRNAYLRVIAQKDTDTNLPVEQ
jgi:hypothetical protein